MQQRLPMIKKEKRKKKVFFFFTFLLLNQEHGINNECSQSIQPVRHSKWTHRVWPRQKDRSTRKKKKKEMFLAHSAHLPVQYSMGPCLFKGLILSQTGAFRLPPPFWNHGPICASSPCLKWCPTAGASLFRFISPVFSWKSSVGVVSGT